MMDTYKEGTFGYDLNFLAAKDTLIVLTSNNQQSQLIISPKYQAKVFTSTAEGLNGKSIGFVNYKVLNSDVIDEHMNGYGGENRFWLGPEGGQYSIFFKKDKEQSIANWYTPKPIDIETWDLSSRDETHAAFIKKMSVSNYKGYTLDLEAKRKIQLLETEIAYARLGLEVDRELKLVAYTTMNEITNLNNFAWTSDTGTICIWMLDMFMPGPKATTIIPFHEGSEEELGEIATTDYFGEIPADRLKIKGDKLYLKTDGKYRSKLGMNAKRTHAIAGNYDPDSKRLTVITYDVDKDAIYLNQEWGTSKNPLIGDAMNAYNDGPFEDGSIMGPFLELESASPAALLKPNETLRHTHSVYHFIGEATDLDCITEKIFGISTDEIIGVFN